MLEMRASYTDRFGHALIGLQLRCRPAKRNLVWMQLKVGRAF